MSDWTPWTEDDPEKIDVSDQVAAFSHERALLAVERAARELGVELEDIDRDDEEHLMAVGRELCRMAASDEIDNAVQRGILIPDGVDTDGQVRYVLADDGDEF